MSSHAFVHAQPAPATRQPPPVGSSSPLHTFHACSDSARAQHGGQVDLARLGWALQHHTLRPRAPSRVQALQQRDNQNEAIAMSCGSRGLAYVLARDHRVHKVTPVAALPRRRPPVRADDVPCAPPATFSLLCRQGLCSAALVSTHGLAPHQTRPRPRQSRGRSP